MVGGQLEPHGCASMTVPFSSITTVPGIGKPAAATSHLSEETSMGSICEQEYSRPTASCIGWAETGPDDGAQPAYGEYADLV